VFTTLNCPVILDRQLTSSLITTGQARRVWTGLIWLRIEPVAVSCEHGNESSYFIREHQDQLSVLLASEECLCSVELVR
jgi:hypothetical protein